MASAEAKKQLVTRIWERILDKTGSEDEFTNEGELCQEFSISRTQLRDILKELEVLGVIERRQRKGIRIKELSLKEASEIYDVREAVEGMAARLAAINARSEDIRELESCVATHNRAVENRDVHRQVASDLAFHAKIIEMSDNKIIGKMIEQLMLMEKIFRMAGERNPNAPHIPLPETHEAIIEAIKNHDSDKCEKLVKGHIRGAKQRKINQILVTA